jgi:hypothetical protein
MQDQKATTMRRVQETFAAWKTVSDQVKDLERRLQRHDPLRDPPLADFEPKLRALNDESERLLAAAQHALLSIKTPRSSSGDSTWG